MGNAIDYAKSLFDKIFKSGESKKARDEGIRELTEYFESGYSGALPEKPKLEDVPEYERLQYDAPDDEQLRQTAQAGLNGYKHDSVQAIENEAEALKKQYESGKKTAENSYREKSKTVQEAYEQANRATDNDLLKRGIARSSIAANKKAELVSSEAAAKTKAHEAYRAEVDRLTGEIDALDAKRAKALDDFNIAYAAKLTESIESLKKERDNNMKEALKYNNSLAEKEYSAKVDKTMKESDLYGEALGNAKKENDLLAGSAASDARNKEIYNKVYGVLSSMNPIDARELLTETSLIGDNLSGYYYYKLFNEFAG